MSNRGSPGGSPSRTPPEPREGEAPAEPQHWLSVPLGDLLSAIEAGRSFKCEEHPPQAGEVGIVKVSAVTWGTFDELESKTCSAAGMVDPGLLIQSGDFLFSRANTLALVGACVLVGKVQRRLMLSDKILRFRFVLEPDLERWVLWFLRSRAGRRQIETLATGNQYSMRNIGQDRIRQIRIPLAPKRERVSVLDAIGDSSHPPRCCGLPRWSGCRRT